MKLDVGRFELNPKWAGADIWNRIGNLGKGSWERKVLITEHKINAIMFLYNSILSVYLLTICVRVVIEMYLIFIKKKNNFMKSNHYESYLIILTNPYYYLFKRYRSYISKALRELSQLDLCGTFRGEGSF